MPAANTMASNVIRLIENPSSQMAATEPMRATGIATAAGLGLIWGWLPCGLVYGALLLAATTADPLAGGLVMVAFGLGTMPAMIASGLSAAKLSAFMGRNRLSAGLLIVILGIATLAMPIFSMNAASDSPGHSHHQTTE